MNNSSENAVIGRYVDFWNAPTADEQRAAGAEIFDDQVSYRAPVGLLTGIDALVGFKTDFVQHLPGARYLPRESAEEHHGRARLKWEIQGADGSSFAAGTDVLELEPDGRITGVSSFLDRAPEGFHDHQH